MLPPQIVAEMKAIAAARYPNEAVFAYWSEDDWRELHNIHPHPRNAFKVSSEDDLYCLENPPAVLIHTHCSGQAHPSDLDTVKQIASGYPWGIIAVDGTTDPVSGRHLVHSISDPEFFGSGSPIEPLIGRSYLWGVRDCYTLVQSYYAVQGIRLPCVPRVLNGNCRFNEWIPKVGFRRIEPHQVEPGDVGVWQLAHSYPDHCAVYLGEGRFLEQVALRRSGIQHHRFDVLARRNANYYRFKDSNAQDRASWSIDRPLPQAI